MKIQSAWPSVAKTLAGVMAAAVLLVGVPVMTVSATGDDYPFKGRPNQVDPWGFYTGYCTSFTAWRLSQAGIVFHGASLRGPNGQTARFGNGGNWDAAARAVGFTVDSHPSVGAVAVWHGGEGGAWPGGHVAYVIGVSGGQAIVEEYNWSHYLAYDTRVAQAPRYVHFRPAAPVTTAPPKPAPPAPPGPAAVTLVGHPYRVTHTVRVRSAATVQSRPVGLLPAGSRIMVVCQVRSNSVVNGSPIWDRLQGGGYVADYYTTTPGVRAFSPGLPRC
jgi:surface antigen